MTRRAADQAAFNARRAQAKRRAKSPLDKCAGKGCRRKAVVGLNGAAYCIACFDKALEVTGKIIQQLVKENPT